MANTLLLYTTNYGQTRKIAERIGEWVRARGKDITVAQLGSPGIDPAAYDAVVIGGSVKHGKHQPALIEFINSNAALLDAKPSALFSVNLVARKPHRNTPQTNQYMQRLLSQLTWKPKLMTVIAGELDYSRYDTFNRYMMRFILWLGKGPTDLSVKMEFTDWAAVERFAAQIAALTDPR